MTNTELDRTIAEAIGEPWAWREPITAGFGSVAEAEYYMGKTPLPFSTSWYAAGPLLEWWQKQCLQDNARGHKLTVAYDRFFQCERFKTTPHNIASAALAALEALKEKP